MIALREKKKLRREWFHMNKTYQEEGGHNVNCKIFYREKKWGKEGDTHIIF